MKKVILVLFSLFTIGVSQAQDCGEARYMVAIPHVTNIGGGMEIGLWPTDAHRLGFFGGATFYYNKVTTYDSVKNTEQGSIGSAVFYAKTQVRLNRYVGITSTIGVEDFEKLYGGIGLRFSIPLGENNRCAAIAEPQITTFGFKTNIGLGIIIE